MKPNGTMLEGLIKAREECDEDGSVTEAPSQSHMGKHTASALRLNSVT
jgi:hypothetical protein